MRKSAAVIIAVLLIVIGTPVACAHSVLIGSTPTNGWKLQILPTKIILKFADPLLTLGNRAINRIVVTDPMNKVVTVGKDLVKGAVLTHAIVDARPINGVYKVSYRVSTQDGHVVTGAFSFTLQR